MVTAFVAGGIAYGRWRETTGRRRRATLILLATRQGSNPAGRQPRELMVEQEFLAVHQGPENIFKRLLFLILKLGLRKILEHVLELVGARHASKDAQIDLANPLVGRPLLVLG